MVTTAINERAPGGDRPGLPASGFSGANLLAERPRIGKVPFGHGCLQIRNGPTRLGSQATGGHSFRPDGGT